MVGDFCLHVTLFVAPTFDEESLNAKGALE
jgi:hypothetical protein